MSKFTTPPVRCPTSGKLTYAKRADAKGVASRMNATAKANGDPVRLRVYKHKNGCKGYHLTSQGANG